MSGTKNGPVYLYVATHLSNLQVDEVDALEQDTLEVFRLI